MPVVLVIVVVLTVIGIAMVDNALTEITIAGNQGFGVAAVYLADAGIGDAVNRLRGNADLGQTAACTPGTLTFPAGSLESGVYEVCVQRVGTQRLIVSTGRARASPTDTDDAAAKNATSSVRVLPSSFAYAIFGYRNVELRQETVRGVGYAPVVIQRFPFTRPMAIRGGPNAADLGAIHIRLQGGTQIYGGLSSAGIYQLQGGAVNPCQPTGPWMCESNIAGPALPTFDIRGPSPTSYESKARADVGCGTPTGCYFASGAAFRDWVRLTCPAPKCTITVGGRVIGPGIFFVNGNTTIDDTWMLAEIIGTLVIGNGDLTIRAGFTHRPCTSAADPTSCSEPALVVNDDLSIDGGALNTQCRHLFVGGLQYVENRDFDIRFAPDPAGSQDCDPAPGPPLKRIIQVRFGMIIARRDVTIDGEVRVEYDPAALDALPPGLTSWPPTSPVMMPVGWSSR